MKESTRAWIIGGSLIVAGVIVTATGASMDSVEVRAALPAMGAALTTAGLTAVLLRLPLGRMRQPR
jgi:hypothetical protein